MPLNPTQEMHRTRCIYQRIYRATSVSSETAHAHWDYFCLGYVKVFSMCTPRLVVLACSQNQLTVATIIDGLALLGCAQPPKDFLVTYHTLNLSLHHLTYTCALGNVDAVLLSGHRCCACTPHGYRELQGTQLGPDACGR